MRKALVAVALVFVASVAVGDVAVVGPVALKEMRVSMFTTPVGPLVLVTDYLTISSTRARCAAPIAHVCRNAALGSMLKGRLGVDYAKKRVWVSLAPHDPFAP